MSDSSFASDSSAHSLISAAAVLLGLSVVAVILRFLARRYQKASLRVDDWLTLPAIATFIGFCACLFFIVDLRALGYSTGEVSKQEKLATLERSAKTQIAMNLCTIFCLAATRASALFFYKRIFCVSDRKAILNCIIIVSVALVACCMVTFVFLIAFQCRGHFSAAWDGTQLKYCTLSYPAIEGQVISNFMLDVLVLVLPIYPILKLQTTKRRKFAILGIFILACIGVGSSLARLIITIQILTMGQANVHKIDPAKYQSKTVFYAVLEMGVAIVAINLPSAWTVFTSAAPEAILRSIRSVVSLASIGSRGSNGSKKSQNRSDLQYLKSSTSNSSIAPIARASAEAYELGSAGHGHATVPAGQIHISRSVKQTSATRQQEEV